MKVYRLNEDIAVSGPGIILRYIKGWFFCEEEPISFTNKVHYVNKSYPIPQETFDKHKDKFEFIKDETEYDSNYYILPKYTEYELQEKLKSLNT